MHVAISPHDNIYEDAESLLGGIVPYCASTVGLSIGAEDAGNIVERVLDALDYPEIYLISKGRPRELPSTIGVALEREIYVFWRGQLEEALAAHWRPAGIGAARLAADAEEAASSLWADLRARIQRGEILEWPSPQLTADYVALSSPAREMSPDCTTGRETWCRNGVIHRDEREGPAILTWDLSGEWWEFRCEGLRHRDPSEGLAVMFVPWGEAPIGSYWLEGKQVHWTGSAWRPTDE
jgi:hypothetical protein